jgi:hypothetical protein
VAVDRAGFHPYPEGATERDWRTLLGLKQEWRRLTNEERENPGVGRHCQLRILNFAHSDVIENRGPRAT